MNALLDRLADLPRSVKSTLLVVAGAMPMTVLALLGGIDLKLLGIVLAGMLVVVVLLLAYALLLRVLRDRKAKQFEGEIKRQAGTVPQGVTQPAERARLDDLRKKFESGLSRFRVAGRDLYSVPWFLIIGEPGAGKTEAIRHSGIRFPEGLQDEMQGAGGTYNMDWWFTDEAVVLDTAGRMVFGGAESVDSREWSDFLKMIRRHRRRCPINGLLVAIPIDSLTRDDQAELERKAKKLSSQLDVIQKTLDVRFPVFLMITMADKLTGFRPFFARLRGPAALGQILGWSNPEPLDEPFDPVSIGGVVQTIREQLTRRRLSLLQDPVASETLATRRTDEIDELYGFLESVDEIVPRLQCYLEYLFVRGPWSAKAAPLRGIYFTSSMQEGEALDLALANALGVEVDSLHENGAWYEERAYFLKDLFVDKIFKEPGLVFPANANARRRQRQRRLVMSGVALVAGLAVLVATIWGWRDLKQHLRPHVEYWTSAAEVNPLALRLVVGGLYQGGKDIGQGEYEADRVHWLSKMAEKADEKIEINPVFMLSRATDPLDAKPAARRVFEVALLQPAALEAKEAWAEKPDAPQWDDDDTNAMASFLRMRLNEKVTTSDAGGEAGIDVGALLRAPLVGEEPEELEKDVTDLLDAMGRLGSGERWPLDTTLQDDCLDAAKRGREALRAHCTALRSGEDGPLRDALAALASVQAFLDRERDLIAEGVKSPPDRSRWQQKFVALAAAFELPLESLNPEGGAASPAAERDTKSGADHFDKASAQVEQMIAGAYRALLEAAGLSVADVSAARVKLESWPADSVERPAAEVARALLADWVDLDEMDEPEIWKKKGDLVEELRRDVERDGEWMTRIEGRFEIYRGIDAFLTADSKVTRFGATASRLQACEKVEKRLGGLAGNKNTSAANIVQSARASIIEDFKKYVTDSSLTNAVEVQAKAEAELRQAEAGAEIADEAALPLLELDPAKQAQFDPAVFGEMKKDRLAVGEDGLSEAKGLLDAYEGEYTDFWTGKVDECFKERSPGLEWAKLREQLNEESGFQDGVRDLQDLARGALQRVGGAPAGDSSESPVRKEWAGLEQDSIDALVKVLGDQDSDFFKEDPPSLVDRYWERVTKFAMKRLVAAAAKDVDGLLDGNSGFPLTPEGTALDQSDLERRWKQLSDIWSLCEEPDDDRAKKACDSIFTVERKPKVKFLESLIDNLKGPATVRIVEIAEKPGVAGEKDWTHKWAGYSINGTPGVSLNHPSVPVPLADGLSIKMSAPGKQVLQESDWAVLRLIDEPTADTEDRRKWQVKLYFEYEDTRYFVWLEVVFKTALEPRR